MKSARSCRAFLSRVVTYLTAEAGIRQFLDLGSGLPSAQNVHEVAQSIAPQSRVVYVDHDPVVLLHARALLKSRPEGATGFIQAFAARLSELNPAFPPPSAIGSRCGTCSPGSTWSGPGVQIARWRPEPGPGTGSAPLWGGVARKP